MRIHTNLKGDDLDKMVSNLPGVSFERSNESGSRSRARKFDVILEGNSPRAAGFGRGDYKPATYDEWGIFLNRVFEADPEAKTDYYDSPQDFDFKTGGRYQSLKVIDQHKSHKWEPQGRAATGAYWFSKCKCGAIQRRK